MNYQRFVLFPIQYPEYWSMYKKHLACFWTAEEIDLSDDLDHWQSLTDNERHFIKMVLGFFAASDGIVMENISTRFMSDIEIPEVRAFYAVQNMIETIHSETYSLLIDTYVSREDEKDLLFNGIETYDCIRKKADWAIKWMQDKRSFETRLLAFAIVEGVFFSGSFCAIFWLKKRGLMPGLTFSNELISRDEGLHVDFACLLYSKQDNPLPQDEAYAIMDEAVANEKVFLTEALPVELIGMNAHDMSQYIEFVADTILVKLGYQKKYRTKNPFDWMDMISMQGKTNFFEKRVAEYQRAGVLGDDEEFSLNTAF